MHTELPYLFYPATPAARDDRHSQLPKTSTAPAAALSRMRPVSGNLWCVWLEIFCQSPDMEIEEMRMMLFKRYSPGIGTSIETRLPNPRSFLRNLHAAAPSPGARLPYQIERHR